MYISKYIPSLENDAQNVVLKPNEIVDKPLHAPTLNESVTRGQTDLKHVPKCVNDKIQSPDV
jgi:hypothetical protein